MELKIIFLDINGVLNSLSSVEAFGSRSELDPVSVGLLRKLVMATDARIVITSSWRLNYTFHELRQMFRAVGGRKLEKRVLDVTGAAQDTRAAQIRDWVAINNLKGAYVVIDDLPVDSADPLAPVWVKCNPNYGFHYPEYAQALEILNQ